MSRNIKQGTDRHQRLQSAILVSDEDDDNQTTDGNQIQYATSMAQIDTKPCISTTTNQLQVQVTAVTSSSISKLVVQKEQLSITPKPEIIDLTSPMKTSGDILQRNYLPYTLTALNQERLSILPTYPPRDDHDQPSVLLLANIPNNQLSEEERTYRQQGIHKSLFVIIDPNATAQSFIVQQYNTYYKSIMERFNMDIAIADYNYLRLKKFIHICQAAYIRILPFGRSTELQCCNLNENEFPQLLEFYLQIDIDLFYMKTCSFRQKEPNRLANQGIFCITTPECRYVMAPCGNCSLCYSFDQTNNRQQYAVTFNLYQKHRFVNGYESILNCPASCNTNNIIYALTCQCRDYDYIGDTSDTLLKRLSFHQCVVHRLILETLIGEKNYVHFWGGKSGDMARKDSMRLYQHPMCCPSAIQSFLNQNMDYWIFVPMLNKEADRENMRYQSTNTVQPPLPATTTTTTTNVHHGNSIRKCLDTIPQPPVGYKFSDLQITKQYEFFAAKRYQKQTDSYYTVYNATMIAVLPLNTSDAFRRIVHSLFVTHTEAKLNKLGHIFTYALSAPIHQTCWCLNLHHPRY